MNSPNAYRLPTVWLNLLTFVISLTFMVVWLPFVRSLFDGSSYVWGTTFFGLNFGGAGVTVDYLFLIIQLVLFAGLFFTMYRYRNRSLFYGLLIIWWMTVFGNLLADIVINGDMMFHGDTLNVHVSLTYFIVPLAAASLALVATVIRQDMKAREVAYSWTMLNQRLLVAFLIMLPILYVLLSTGETHGTSDQIGVLLAIAQCFYIPFIMRPYESVDQRVMG